MFRLNGSVNIQNGTICETERPAEWNQTFFHSPSIIVWCSISEENVFGLYFFEDENVNGKTSETCLFIMDPLAWSL